MSQLKRDRAKLSRQRSKMQGGYKSFSEDTYNSNNSLAIDAVLTHLNKAGLYATPNEDLYGPDIVVYKGFRPAYYVEVEIKRVWKKDAPEFPWPTVQLPERKRKFIQLGLPIEFWILREDTLVSMIIPDHVINEAQLVEVPNKFVPEGELFFQVPVSECITKEL